MQRCWAPHSRRTTAVVLRGGEGLGEGKGRRLPEPKVQRRRCLWVVLRCKCRVSGVLVKGVKGGNGKRCGSSGRGGRA